MDELIELELRVGKNWPIKMFRLFRVEEMLCVCGTTTK